MRGGLDCRRAHFCASTFHPRTDSGRRAFAGAGRAGAGWDNPKGVSGIVAFAPDARRANDFPTGLRAAHVISAAASSVTTRVPVIWLVRPMTRISARVVPATRRCVSRGAQGGFSRIARMRRGHWLARRRRIKARPELERALKAPSRPRRKAMTLYFLSNIPRARCIVISYRTASLLHADAIAAAMLSSLRARRRRCDADMLFTLTPCCCNRHAACDGAVGATFAERWLCLARLYAVAGCLDSVIFMQIEMRIWRAWRRAEPTVAAALFCAFGWFAFDSVCSVWYTCDDSEPF